MVRPERKNPGIRTLCEIRYATSSNKDPIYTQRFSESGQGKTSGKTARWREVGYDNHVAFLQFDTHGAK